MCICRRAVQPPGSRARGRLNHLPCCSPPSLSHFFLRERCEMLRQANFSSPPPLSSSVRPGESHLLRLSLCWSPEKIEQAGRQGNKSGERRRRMAWNGAASREEEETTANVFSSPSPLCSAPCSPCVLMKTSLFVLLLSAVKSFLPFCVRPSPRRASPHSALCSSRSASRPAGGKIVPPEPKSQARAEERGSGESEHFLLSAPTAAGQSTLKKTLSLVSLFSLLPVSHNWLL